MKNILYTLIVFGITFASCTITKRKYLPGYSVDFKKSFHVETTQNVYEANVYLENSSVPDSIIERDVLNGKLEGVGLEILKDTIKNSTVDCDTIFLTNGSQIVAKIESIQGRVYFKKCGELNAFNKSVSIDDVSQLKYADGKIIELVDDQSDISKEKKNDKLGFLGVSFLLPGLPLMLLELMHINYYESSAYLYFGLLLLLGVSAIVFGIVSIRRICKHPEIYHKASLMIAILSILMGLFLIFVSTVIILS